MPSKPIPQPCEICGKMRMVPKNRIATLTKCRSCAGKSKGKQIIPIPTHPPYLGEIRRADQVGMKTGIKLTWHACIICGKERWVRFTKGKPVSERCPNCRGMAEKNKGTLEHPCVGDKCRGEDIGRVSGCYIYATCPQCQKPRWTQYVGAGSICKECHLKKHGSECSNWKGGKVRSPQGYVLIWLPETDFFHPMAKQYNRVAEHRLVMAQHLGRCLWDWEVVHHKNGIKDDNRIENLELSTAQAHSKDHSQGYRDGYAKGLADARLKQIEELKEQNETLIREIRFLQLQVKGELV